MSSTDLKPLTIGTWVTVRAVGEMKYNDVQERTFLRRPVEMFLGQITGLATRQEGRYQRGSGPGVFYGSPFESDYEEPALVVTGTVKVWLVRCGLMNREIEVHNDDLDAIEHKERTPMRRIGVPSYLESHA